VVFGLLIITLLLIAGCIEGIDNTDDRNSGKVKGYNRDISSAELLRLNAILPHIVDAERRHCASLNPTNPKNPTNTLEGMSNDDESCAEAVSGTVLSVGADVGGLFDGLLSEPATLVLTGVEGSHVGYNCAKAAD
jgi:hypothetical protein